MRQHILKEAITRLAEDTKLVRLATVTMFIHSLLFTIYVLYMLLRYSIQWFENENIVELIQQYLTLISLNTGMMIVIVVIALFLVIGYYLLPPIGDAALIHFLNDNDNHGMVALAKGIYKFFPMFEYNAAVSVFKIELIGFMMLRFASNDLLNNPFIIILLVMRILTALFVAIFFPYTKVLITLEDLDFFPAMKRSMELTLRNFGLSMQFVVVTLALSVRFIINILLLVGVPLALIWAGTIMNLDQVPFIEVAFIFIVIFLILLVAYIEGIIAAFFLACRRNVYKYITTR